MRRVAFAALIFPCILSAQAILQHTIAAGAGTAAGAILGKQVSRALDVVEAAAKQGEGVQPAEKKREEWKRWVTGGGRTRAVAAEAEQAATAPAPAADMPVRRDLRPVRAATVSPAWGGSSWFPSLVGSVRESRAQGQAPAPEITAGDLAAISTGTVREEVVEKLGTPVARVTIPESGRFLEVYYYQSGGETLGAVRLDAGEVTEVQLARERP
jgi:hypothetical protein